VDLIEGHLFAASPLLKVADERFGAASARTATSIVSTGLVGAVRDAFTEGPLCGAQESISAVPAVPAASILPTHLPFALRRTGTLTGAVAFESFRTSHVSSAVASASVSAAFLPFTRGDAGWRKLAVVDPVLDDVLLFLDEAGGLRGVQDRVACASLAQGHGPVLDPNEGGRPLGSVQCVRTFLGLSVGKVDIGVSDAEASRAPHGVADPAFGLVD